MQVNAISSLLQTLLASPVKQAAPVPFAPEPAAQPVLGHPTLASPTQSVQMLVTLAAATMPPETERRRLVSKKAQKGLDALEMLQAALVLGVSSAEPVRELRSWMEERTPSEDPEIEALMDEIDLRVQVELAKLELE
jgi:hypothetical protein